MFNLLEYIFSTTRLSEKQNNTANDTENGKQNKTLGKRSFAIVNISNRRFQKEIGTESDIN